jgi:hypothetical protein
MSTAVVPRPASRYDIARRPAASVETIEWEELPSLTGLLSQRLALLGARHISENTQAGGFDPTTSHMPVWTETMPSALDPLEPSGPYCEPIEGLVTREVTEPDVFRHFFGATVSR